VLVVVLVMAAEVDLAHGLEREGVDIGARRGAQVHGRDKDVVHIEEQATAGALDEAGEEIGLGHLGFRKGEVGGRVFEQHPAAEGLLDGVDVGGDPVERGGGVGQGEQVVEEGPAVGGPRQMLGEAGRVEPVDQVPQAGQMGGVERALAADGQADAMDRDGKAGGEVAQLRQGAAAVAHVVLGMDLEPADRAGIGGECGEVARLVAHAGAVGQRPGGGGVEHGSGLREGR
jgi:hypothetical protein